MFRDRQRAIVAEPYNLNFRSCSNIRTVWCSVTPCPSKSCVAYIKRDVVGVRALGKSKHRQPRPHNRISVTICFYVILMVWICSPLLSAFIGQDINNLYKIYMQQLITTCSHGVMATRLSSNQKILGSTPSVSVFANFSLFHFFYFL